MDFGEQAIVKMTEEFRGATQNHFPKQELWFCLME
jgi:hypothetical protein